MCQWFTSNNIVLYLYLYFALLKARYSIVCVSTHTCICVIYIRVSVCRQTHGHKKEISLCCLWQYGILVQQGKRLRPFIWYAHKYVRNYMHIIAVFMQHNCLDVHILNKQLHSTNLYLPCIISNSLILVLLSSMDHWIMDQYKDGINEELRAQQFHTCAWLTKIIKSCISYFTFRWSSNYEGLHLY